jgi:thioredoxin reductase (NADPH)
LGIENVIIVGSGPAAYTAALYTSRANLKPLIIEGDGFHATAGVPGGQLMITTEVENYPGFPKGIQGPELMQLMREQIERFGTRIEQGWIEKVDFTKRPFKLFASEGKTYEAKAIILATGAGAKFLGIPSEKALMNKGVSACATCDGALPIFRNKEIAVVGGGDTAIEEATYLTRFASKVTIVHRREELRASKIMQDKAKKNPKMAFAWNAVVSEVLGTEAGKVTGLKLKDVKTNQERTLPVTGVFIAIGHEPNTAFVKGAVELDDKGYVKVSRGTYTNVEGVFAAGDCVDHVYRQAITAAGQGCMAAIDTERWLEAQEH